MFATCVSPPRTPLSEILLKSSSTAVDIVLLPIYITEDVGFTLEALPVQKISLSTMAPYLIDAHRHHPLFEGITHLDVIDWPVAAWEAYAGLALMPRLTHLSFRPRGIGVLISICRGALTHCKLLNVLVVVYDSQEYLVQATTHTINILDTDPRFVAMVGPAGDFVEEWQKQVRGGGGGHWAVADALVKYRQLGKSATSAETS